MSKVVPDQAAMKLPQASDCQQGWSMVAATTALNRSVDWTLHPFSDVLSCTWRKVPLLGPVRCLAMGDGPARCRTLL